ncbi:aldehyde dehydrogenase (NADP(+)) [Microbacterium sp. G2-8]|uniref:aldehyde dehydrogenase (NADP(+)) n=1 Tax=Microbacterium sp. G2-8 TaxID=2842454 RepID=UPI001C897899|nr:aldehyde dehydrogenase (NADP(+)) [Microbacterium sp. G2-8]
MTATAPADVDALCRAAADAFTTTLRTTDAERAAWLRAGADALDSAAAELIPLADAETSLGSPRLTGELARTTSQLRLFADVILEGSYLEATIDHPNPTATPPIPDLRRALRPLGPVAVFAASNFPFAFSVAGGDTASALAIGCPVVVKLHSGHPRLSRRVHEILESALRDAGAPEGILGLVDGREGALALADHPAITAVGFTGSIPGGRAIHDRVSARPAPIPFFGELGSLNPVVVTPAADVARGSALAEGLAGSFQLGVGQFCTKPGVVFVPADSALEAAVGAHATTPGRMLTERIAQGFADGAARVRDVPGVTAVAGDGGSLIAAVDVDTLAAHADVLLEEVFGPFTLLVRCADEQDLLRGLDLLEGNLTATLHSEPDEDVDAVLSALERIAGRVLFSGWPTGVAVSWAQHHGGPWPATTSQHTSVGATAVRRFQRPIAYQDAPERVLPAALQEANPLAIPRRVDGELVLPRR